MAQMVTRSGEVAYIDDKDIAITHRCNTWWITRRGNNKYVEGWDTGKKKHVLLHQLITGHKYVRHIDGNGLNNRRSNLKIPQRNR